MPKVPIALDIELRFRYGTELPSIGPQGGLPMRSLYVIGFMAGIVFALLASARPSAAVIIYPWCANFGAGGVVAPKIAGSYRGSSAS
jgi:hypothetical protein